MRQLRTAAPTSRSYGVIEPVDNPDRNFRKVETLKMRDPAALSNFCGPQAKLSALLARSEDPVPPECYDELRKQCIAEVQAFEEYLNRKEEILAYLKVESRQA